MWHWARPQIQIARARVCLCMLERGGAGVVDLERGWGGGGGGRAGAPRRGGGRGGWFFYGMARGGGGRPPL
jgi:hypothetical protein